MPEYAAEKQIRLATEREVNRVAEAAALVRAQLQATIDEQAATIAALTAEVEKVKQDIVKNADAIAAIDTKVEAAVEVKP